MRVSTAFSRLLRLPGVWVRSVDFEPDRVVVVVALRRRRLRCPKCSYSTRHRENRQDHESVWRHLDLGVWRLEVRASLRRLRCPEHGVLVEGVPFAEGHRAARVPGRSPSVAAWRCLTDPSLLLHFPKLPKTSHSTSISTNRETCSGNRQRCVSPTQQACLGSAPWAVASASAGAIHLSSYGRHGSEIPCRRTPKLATRW
jgi:hypothetical protein